MVSTEQTKRSITRRLHEFDPNSYEWEEWEFLFDTYLDVEGVNEDSTKKNLLITSLGVLPFKTLIAICKPKKPTDYSYQQLVEKLRSNYARVTFPSTERIKFFATRQESSQTLTDFANDLRDKSTRCKFPSNFYEEGLITAFVGGLQNDHVRKHLMQRNLETFEETINMAKTIASVLIEGSQTRTSSSEELNLNKINKSRKPITNPQNKTTCLSCGNTGHLRSACRFRNATCHKCNKEGHIAKVCRSKGTQTHYKVNTIASISNTKITVELPMRVQIQVNGVPVDFEFDTGSPITVVTDEVWKMIGKPKLNQTKVIYHSFTGHAIHFRGEALVQVNYNTKNTQLNLFVGGVNRTNIIGRNWFNALQLNKQTLDDIVSKNKILHVNSSIDSLDQLLNDYKDIFKESLGCCKIKAQLHIKPNITPKYYKARSLPFAYRQAVETELNRLVTVGVLEPVDMAKWAAPIVVVPKSGNKIRLCADFSMGVNEALDIDKYPLPKPNDIFVALNGGVLFSKIDLSEAYLQIEVEDYSKDLLVINTHKGLFRYNRLPFGIASAPSIFQKIMDQMLAGLDGTICYLDDIIITGKNKIDHLNNLTKLFERIKDYGFNLNKHKCVFLQNQVEYLGFTVDKNGIHSSSSKIKAIRDMPKPENLSQLRSFLGMINHYAKFIPRLSDRLSIFYSLLKKDTVWEWNETCDTIFSNIKKLLTSPLALTHYDPTIPLILATDASNSGVGAVIYHRYSNGSEKAIAFASKTLTPTESKYSQIEKEALGIIYGVHKFDQYLRGRKFTLLTDHKPLTFIFGSKKGVPTTSANRLQRWAIRLMGYTFDIEYCPTNKFGQADGLSRLPVGPDTKFDKQDPGGIHMIELIQKEYQQELPLRASQIAQATRKDALLKLVYHYILSGWPPKHDEQLQPYFRIRHEFSTSNGCITWGLRTVIPSCFRNRLLKHLHSTHSGMGRMKAEARRYFWWPFLDKDVENLVRKCQACSENSRQPVKVPLQQWNVPDQPWQRIHIDFMGKFFGLYFLIIVDAHSKWLEVAIMNNISTSATIDILSSLFARYGLCVEIVSDNGSQFTSQDFAEFCARNGIRHIRTSPAHPQSNGQAEKYVDTVKSALRKGLFKGGKISDVLSKFLFSYRTTPHSTTNTSPAELFLKRQLRSVLDLLRPNAADASSVARQRYQINFDRHTKERYFYEGNKVLVRDFRKNTNKVKWTPGVLITRQGSRLWTVQVENHTWRRHENQIRHREYSLDEDSIIMDSDVATSRTTDHDKCSSTSSSSSDQQPQTLKRSSRLKKPVRRLIEEI